MTKSTRTVRTVTARRVTSSLAALAAAGSLSAVSAQADEARTDTEDLLILAQAEGEGEGEAASGGEGEGEGEAASGGEGEGEGEGGGADLPADVALLRDLAFMEGHIRAGLTLYEQGDLEAARTHMGHPIEEKYEAVAAPVEEMGHGDLKGQIEALAAAAESGADLTEVRALFETVRATHEAIRAEHSPAQQAAGLVALTRVAGDEYTVAVKGGEVSNLHEYQDSWGFLRVVETEAGQMADSDDAAVAAVGADILDHLAATDAAYGDIQGEGGFEMDPSILYGAAAQMQIAALDFEGESHAGAEGEGEGEGESQ